VTPHSGISARSTAMDSASQHQPALSFD